MAATAAPVPGWCPVEGGVVPRWARRGCHNHAVSITEIAGYRVIVGDRVVTELIQTPPEEDERLRLAVAESGFPISTAS